MMLLTWNDDVECGVCSRIFDKGTPMHMGDLVPPICDHCWTEMPEAVQVAIQEATDKFLTSMQSIT